MIERDRWFRWLEWGFFPLGLAATNLVNAASVVADYRRLGIPLAPWEPLSWEFSSGAMILALIPTLLWVDRRRPFEAGSWPSTLALHAALTVPFSALHVAGMVAIRKAAYLMMGATYDFGDLPAELFYEYRKDVRSYLIIIVIFYAYRHLRFRFSGAGGELVGKAKNAGALPTRILIRGEKRETFLDLDQIEWIEAAGNYVNIHAEDRRFFLRGTLNQVEKKVSPERFVRVHRSNIVNLDRVREIVPTPSGDGLIMMKSGAHVGLSRRYRDRLSALRL